ncbi:hypothetical protein, partial [Methanocalculus sp.]|uniref:hypothetical protein n=1 Tax=Methanocalculus sp. TaxID=2004547 RepID=UPI002606DE59
MKSDEFISRIVGNRYLEGRQQENVTNLLCLSGDFCRDAGVLQRNAEHISEETIVLESGHQPNFLPYPGVWKKAFLLDRITKYMIEQGHAAVAFFGFADQNLSTASLLTANHIPAFKKGGNEKIGFGIREKDRWRCFNEVPKPDIDEWQAEMGKIAGHYLSSAKQARVDLIETERRIDTIFEMLWQSYERACNFSDANAFFFAKISAEIFDLDVRFFRYSDLQRKGIFADEIGMLLEHREAYFKYYNAVITEKSLNISPIRNDHIPLWYRCPCGGKIGLAIGKEDQWQGTCPACGNAITLESSDEFPVHKAHCDQIDLTAVARNIVFAEGLGTSVFFSGAGGGLQYGQIATR